ncbi:bifunctional diaminohydroxyphosphoribosylaminopyrimidine deaminase/5-amino-6-(5-phosphoribosylamino)uracil reductase RibD [Sphaerisporangium sp. NPDC051011]|uniref:bifunctional diaminohydroxyphosphoribosylaminopyrimidine deaminase/5-amino-6-(5-phosphoribosylamino)uracil reductase RibD n=1 Tax=Sphaerisporangium sp. NPDC051011 TaxID=3155792 RepID=UPI00340BD718
MRRAIALSAHGLGTASPNPPVGCVILNRQGRLVGEGYHQKKGDAHAEGNALRAAGASARGATAVVTLEPCNHVGRAPACRELLINAGVSRVVVALIDPTSRGSGGVAELRKAGVEVETGVLAEEAGVVLGPWLTALRTGTPAVTWTYLVSGSNSDEIPHLDRVRRGYDAVLFPDGRFEEGIRGGHGTDTFALPPHAVDLGSADLLKSLYAGGVRSLLLAGRSNPLMERLAAAGLIDEIFAYLPDNGPSSGAAEDWTLIPIDFKVIEIHRVQDHVRVRALRRQA